MALINQINLTCNQDRMQASQAVVSVNQPSIVVSGEVIASTGWLVLTFNKYQYNIVFYVYTYINIEDTNQSPIKQDQRLFANFYPVLQDSFIAKPGRASSCLSITVLSSDRCSAVAAEKNI